MSVANVQVTHEHRAWRGGGSESLRSEFKIAVRPFRTHRRRYPLNRFQWNLVYEILRKIVAQFHVAFRSDNLNISPEELHIFRFCKDLEPKSLKSDLNYRGYTQVLAKPSVSVIRVLQTVANENRHM